MPKKKNAQKKEETILLSETEVKKTWDYYQFAKAAQSGYLPSAMNPLLLNQRMADVSLNPYQPDQDKLDAALKDPKNNEDYLQGLSQSFEISSSVYKRLIEYLATMLSFDISYIPRNVSDKGEYTSLGFKKDEKIVEEFLDNFDYVNAFSTAVKQMLRSETFFCSPRFDMENYQLQEMPSGVNWTKITGRWSYGLLWSLNMFWFWQPGVSLEMYSPFFTRAYNDLWGNKNGKMKEYIPNISPELRGNSSWVYWQDVPPSAGHVFKMSPEIVSRLPHYVGLMSDLILQPLMRNLQKSISMAEATKILSGQVPFLNNQSSKVADALSMSPEVLGRFLGLISSAISSAIKTIAAPLENISPISFDGNDEMYPSYLKNTLAASGVNTSLIFTSNQRANILESNLSLQSDLFLMYKLYPQFSQFLNYHINKRTKKYKWNFMFEGSNFSIDRESRWNTQMDLMERGIVLPQKISSALGMKPHHLRKMMEQSEAEGFIDKLTPIIQSNQLSKDSAGRPSMSDSEIGDAGAQTKEAGSNISKTKSKK